MASGVGGGRGRTQATVQLVGGDGQGSYNADVRHEHLGKLGQGRKSATLL
jgi:hypothetical protein